MKQEQNRGKRCHCIVCGAELGTKPLLEMAHMPASAQKIPLTKEEAENEAVDLRLFQCPGCGLVQFDCEPVDYYRDVIRSGGYSTTMVELRTRQYRHLIDAKKCAQTEHRYGPITGKFVLYRGGSQEIDGIQYQNVEEYLRSLA